jgi:tRNA (adenine57-N1/adenine58-N1)-methyltransferase
VGKNGPEIGEPVGVILPDGSKKVFILSKEGKTETKYGFINHTKLLNHSWGDIIRTSIGKELLLYKPSMNEIVLNIFKRRSQVIYPKDSAIMIMESGIRKGDRVGEAGVGSGYLTAFILEKIGEEGEYFGYDTRDDMIQTAKNNIEKLFPSRITIHFQKRDIRKEKLEEGLNAFFLDMPDPWKALKNIHYSLKPSGRLLVFVPTANQVIKTLREARKNLLFEPLKIMVSSIIEYQMDPEAIRPLMIQPVFTGYIMIFSKRG